MKYLLILAVAAGLVGCETTGNKRQNGTNTEHVNAKLKNITVHGTLNIGGGKQNTSDASQEGLGKVKAEAKVEDTLNGQEDVLKAVVAPEPVEAPLDAPQPPLSLED